MKNESSKQLSALRSPFTGEKLDGEKKWEMKRERERGTEGKNDAVWYRYTVEWAVGEVLL